MPSFRLSASRAGAQRVPRRHPGLLSVVALALLAISIGAAAAAGGYTGFGWVAFASTWIAVAIPVALPAVGNATAALALVAAAYLARRAYTGFLIQRPGPVRVFYVRPSPSDSKSAASVGSASDCSSLALQVVGALQEELGKLELDAVPSVPGEASRTNMIQEVKSAAEAKNSVGVVAGIVAAIIPSYAYVVEVQALEKTSASKNSYITITISTVLRGDGRTHRYALVDPQVVARDAAHEVAAFILPRSRLCQKPPWTAWRGYELPSSLLRSARLATELNASRAYDRALEAWDECLDRDPQNPYFRIRKLQVFEQLGMYLEAVAGYADVIRIESGGDRRLRLGLTDYSIKVLTLTQVAGREGVAMDGRRSSLPATA